MNAPKEFTIRIKNKATNKAIKNLIVYVGILATYKNNYYLGPFFTDKNGEFLVARKMIVDEIEWSFKNYPMDYSSTIERCKDEIEISIDEITQLKKNVAVIKEFYPEKAEELKNLIKNAVNDKDKNYSVISKVAPLIEAFI